MDLLASTALRLRQKGRLAEPAQELEWVDLSAERDADLLKAVASGLYLDCFPTVEEREDPSLWSERLWSDVSDAQNPLLRIIITGNNLHTRDRSIAGFVC